MRQKVKVRDCGRVYESQNLFPKTNSPGLEQVYGLQALALVEDCDLALVSLQAPPRLLPELVQELQGQQQHRHYCSLVFGPQA